jgi:hypothetical protein
MGKLFADLHTRYRATGIHAIQFFSSETPNERDFGSAVLFCRILSLSTDSQLFIFDVRFVASVQGGSLLGCQIAPGRNGGVSMIRVSDFLVVLRRLARTETHALARFPDHALSLTGIQGIRPARHRTSCILPFPHLTMYRRKPVRRSWLAASGLQFLLARSIFLFLARLQNVSREGAPSPVSDTLHLLRIACPLLSFQ